MSTLGLDIGGANLKAAHSAGAMHCQPFALWKKPDGLLERLRTIAARLPDFARLAVTMTGELCDCFPTRRAGVEHILDAADALAGSRPVRVWLTDGRFGTTAEARRRPMQAAAANWHVLATWVAGLHPAGLTLLLDTGSTTTDILVLSDGQVAARGRTDTQRLASGELVYVGAIRTPLMALGPHVTWDGRTYRLMAEHFATTADVYVLSGDIRPDATNTDTADGRPLVESCAAARVLRMVGADLEMHANEDARRLASLFAAAVESRLREAIRQVLAGRRPDRVVVTGTGSFLAAAAATAELLSVPVLELDESIDANSACAMALVRLCDAGCGALASDDAGRDGT